MESFNAQRSLVIFL